MASLRLVIYALLWVTTALSLPVDHQRVLGTGTRVECEKIDTFTPEWFLRNTKDEYRKEIHGKALFYTRGASKYAQQLACGTKDYVSIWQIWPQWLYNDQPTNDNRLRCIHSDPKLTQKFYESMSNAYARMARKHATIMHLSKDYSNPPLDGIWGRTELPVLRDKTDIISLSKINEKNTQNIEWLLPDKGAKVVYDRAIEEVHRIFRVAKGAWSGVADANADACFLWSSKQGGVLDNLW